MTTVFLSEPAENELGTLSPSNQEEVACAISFLEDDGFRRKNKVDLSLIEDGSKIYSLVVGVIWLAFCEDLENSVRVVWLSVRSRFYRF